ncbi:MAG: shikimate kinase [Subdoligranulum sp.]
MQRRHRRDARAAARATVGRKPWPGTLGKNLCGPGRSGSRTQRRYARSPTSLRVRARRPSASYESQAVAEISKQTRQVIACGGGVIKTPGNARALRQNGPVLWVRRPVAAAGYQRPRRFPPGGTPCASMEAERECRSTAAAVRRRGG